MGTYTILYSAVVSGTASTGSPGDVLIPDATTGLYVRATTANRGTRRATGIALTSYVAGGTVDIIQYGEVPTTITGFTAAAASWVRCSTTGSLEKVTPSGADDILGKVDTDGRLFLDPGKWDATNYAGGSSTAPTGTGFATVTAGVMDAASTTSSANLRGYVSDPTGTAGRLVFSSSPTFSTPLINNAGATFTYNFAVSAIAANRTITLPLLTGPDTFVFADFIQTLTNKTIAGASNTLSVRIANDVTGLGSNVATALATFSSANIKTACTDETGSGGALVFATSPTLTTPTINGQVVGPAIAMGASAIDWSLGPVFTKTLAAGANTFTWSNQASGMVITVRVTGAASTLAWPTVKWAGGVAPTQTASGIDVYTFVHDGTSVYGSVVQAMA